MKILRMRMLAIPASLVVLSFGAATAPWAQDQEGLVNVKLTNVANNIARDLDVNVSNIPITVQAPVSVAAVVCDVDAAVLAQQAESGDAECTAQSTSEAFTSIVQENVTEQPGRGRGQAKGQGEGKGQQ